MESTNLPIPEIEKENIKHLGTSLEKASKKLGHTLEWSVVGGATVKPWPRKDIDVLCTILDLKGKLKGTQLDMANQELNLLVKITEEAISYNNRFSIDKVIRPYMDHEFETPDILAFRGVVRLKSKFGVPIEIIGGLG